MSKKRSLLLGIIAGGAVSAAVTLLSAPASGSEVRTRMKDQAKYQQAEFSNFLKHLKEESLRLKAQLNQKSKESAFLIQDLTKEMKSSIEEWKETIEPHQENIYQYLDQIETSIKDLEEKVQKDAENNTNEQ